MSLGLFICKLTNIQYKIYSIQYKKIQYMEAFNEIMVFGQIQIILQKY